MKYFLSIFVFIIIGIQTPVLAQSAIKLKKQQTKFFYFQLNGHYGNNNFGNESRKGLATFGSANQIAVQYFSKNKKRLQRGFTNSWEKGNFFIRAEIVARPSYINNKELISLQLNLNAWMSLFTKWDRTGIRAGTRNLPYGHNPQIDADFPFLSPQVKADLGFSKDFGLFFKTALAKNIDIESALTLGGYLSRPILTSRIINQAANDENLMRFNDFNYKGTWLFTNRIGTPTYKTMEYGLFASVGHIYSPKIQNELEHIGRIGVDWIVKYKDMVKLANQISIGSSNPDNDRNNPYKSISIQNTLDCTIFGVINMSFSHNWQKYNYKDIAGYKSKRILMASTTLIITPDVKFKWNMYKEYLKETDNRVGFYGQVIVGFGKRP